MTHENVVLLHDSVCIILQQLPLKQLGSWNLNFLHIPI